jgi:flagellar FliJ protein
MFKFKLEFLLRYRKQKEETAMFELAQKVRQANQIDAEIMELGEKSVGVAEAVSRTVGTCLPASVLLLYKDHQEYLRNQAKEASKRLGLAEQQIEKQRQVLVEKSKDRKMVEVYKENLKSAYQKEEAIREQKNLDELAMLARLRRDHE